jgi:hypothetical protein
VLDVTVSGLGSGVSAKELILTGLALTALAISTGRVRFALFPIIPTLLIAGAANLIAWFTGGDDDRTSGQPATSAARAAAPSPSAAAHHHAFWSGWIFGVTAPLAVLLIGILVVTAYARARRAGRAGDEAGVGPWSSDTEQFTPYPDEPSPVAEPALDDGGPADPYALRMNVLAYDFLSHVCTRGGGPALVDIQEPLTQGFLAAFTDATDLFLADGSRDPRRLAAAIRDAERRWTRVKLDLGRRVGGAYQGSVDDHQGQPGAVADDAEGP